MKKVKFNLAMAGYTYNKFSVDRTLDDLERLDIHYLCVSVSVFASEPTTR